MKTVYDKKLEEGDTEEEPDERLNAKFNLWVEMAYYVGKKLCLRPQAILTSWGCSELLVAYGVFVNEESKEIYNRYQALDAETKNKVRKDYGGSEPEEFIVKFVTFDKINEINNRVPDKNDEIFEKLFKKRG